MIIGVHSPEFAFEHVSSNVAAAVKRLGIKYPVVQDNDFATWTNYSNEYWPAEYLIDQQGRIRAYDTGEGNYAEMEQNIRELLGVSNQAATVPDLTPTDQTTPESYLGYVRLDPMRYSGSIIAKDQAKTYPPAVRVRRLARLRRWMARPEKDAIAGKHASLTLHFQAEDVYLVLGGRGKVTVSIDGKPTRTVESARTSSTRCGAAQADARPDDARVHARCRGLRLHLRLDRGTALRGPSCPRRRPARAPAESG